MKKVFILLTVMALAVGAFSCGGGGAGGLDSPGGENPWIASVLTLSVDKNVAQTGSYVYFHAKVLDGNGNPLAGKTVNFTNVAGGGEISGVSISSIVTGFFDKSASAVTTAVTNGYGIASVRVRLTSDGFVTLVAEYGGLRDKRSAYFTSSDSTKGLSFTPIAVNVDVDGNNNGIYNESDDMRICQTVNDNVLRVRTTVYIVGARASGVSVNVLTDYDIMATFPNTPYGSDNDADLDIDEDNIVTNSQGEAFTELSVNCLVENVERILNVYASTPTYYIQEFDGNFSGVGGISLFLQPVTVTGITVTATPDTILSAETSIIRATVHTTAGSELDGILVQFNTSCGTTDPTVTTTVDGVAETTFTPPSYPGPCTITAKVGSVTGSAIVTVTTPLAVLPSSQTVVAGSSATFTIIGGFPIYNIYANTAASWAQPSPSTVTTNPGIFTVLVPAGTPAGSVTYTIRDSRGTTVTATLTITTTGAGTLDVIPSTQTIDPTVTLTATYTILGGTAPFTAYSNNPSLVTVGVAGTTLTATVVGVPAADTTVTLTVYDSYGKTDSVSLVLDVPTAVPTPDFTISCAPTNVDNIITASTCTLTAVNGYTGIISLSCSPAVPTPGATCVLAPSSLALSTTATSTLTYTCGLTGTAFFTIDATDGVLTHSQLMGAACP